MRGGVRRNRRAGERQCLLAVPTEPPRRQQDEVGGAVRGCRRIGRFAASRSSCFAHRRKIASKSAHDAGTPDVESVKMRNLSVGLVKVTA